MWRWAPHSSNEHETNCKNEQERSWQRRPELGHYFDDLASAKAFRDITPRETKLTAALAANVALRVQAERLIAAYIEPNSDPPAVLNFDGPQQREVRKLPPEALGWMVAGEDRS